MKGLMSGNEAEMLGLGSGGDGMYGGRFNRGGMMHNNNGDEEEETTTFKMRSLLIDVNANKYHDKYASFEDDFTRDMTTAPENNYASGNHGGGYSNGVHGGGLNGFMESNNNGLEHVKEVADGSVEISLSRCNSEVELVMNG